MGKVKQAIETEKKAVNTAPDNDEFNEILKVYEKAKNDE